MKRSIRLSIFGIATGILAASNALVNPQIAAKAASRKTAAGSQVGIEQPPDAESLKRLQAEMERFVDSHATNPALSAKLRVDLMAFAKQNSLDDNQIQRLLGEMVMTSTAWEKGGVGPIDRGTAVLLDGNQNRLMVGQPPHRQIWVGQDFNHQQLVIADGERVLGSFTTDDLSKLRILLFRPSEVRFIDLGANWGGRFLREKNDQPKSDAGQN